MRLVFLGTPEPAVTTLVALVDAGHDVALVVSRADARRGRGNALVPSPVKAAALERGIPETANVDDVLALDPPADLGVVVAFGRIIRPHVLAALPMVNIHFSRLPRWRGAAPVERAMLAGDEVTGVCLMEVEEGLDTGGVYRRADVEIGPDETADELRARLTTIGTGLLLDALAHGLGDAEPQVGEPTYAHKVEPAEHEIVWAEPAAGTHARVRIGGAWTTFRGRRLKVWRTRLAGSDGPRRHPGAIRTEGRRVLVTGGDGEIELLEVQAEGKGRAAAGDWARGAHLADDEQFE